jgi:deazaflavin-dependent oxidoreductase (nitroreductase family)
MSDTPAPQPGANPALDYSLLNESHVAAYLETNGERGGIWNGATAVLVTTIGRKSGEKRTIAIIGKQVGENFVIIASKGGAPDHPLWYKNILADPNVEFQYLADKWEGVARTAESPEREALWAEACTQWPYFNDYQARTERKIPVVVLEPRRKLN